MIDNNNQTKQVMANENTTNNNNNINPLKKEDKMINNLQDIKGIYTAKMQAIIEKYDEIVRRPIVVMDGVAPYVDMAEFTPMMVDSASFEMGEDAAEFSDDWCAGVVARLSDKSQDYYVLSYAQYAKLSEYNQSKSDSTLSRRVVMVYDNLQNLFSLEPKARLGEELQEPLFTDCKLLEECNAGEQGLDLFTEREALAEKVKGCYENQNWQIRLVANLYNDSALSDDSRMRLEQMNAFLDMFGGGIYLNKEVQRAKAYAGPSKEALDLLHKHWGAKASFRTINVYQDPNIDKTIKQMSQGEPVDWIINQCKKHGTGKTPYDLFMTAFTGAGKSLIFQLPAFYASAMDLVTIVISPLKSLMSDQVEALSRDHGYEKAAYINSDLSYLEREEIIQKCMNHEIDILYVSPELLLSYHISYFIGERELGLVVIDEAHLITTWGRDFRVDYWALGKYLHDIRKNAKYNCPVVAFTATAVYGGENDMVKDSISSLMMRNPRIILGEVRRDDISFAITTYATTARNYKTNKINDVVKFLRGAYAQGWKMIMYVPYASLVTTILDQLLDIQDGVVGYTGTMSAIAKEDAYNRFKSGQSKIMIATKAFGMGIDIPDIQVVYHYAPSGLLPDYVQEVGRVARDKNMRGVAVTSFTADDMRYSKQLFGFSSLKQYQLRMVLNKIYQYYLDHDKQRKMLMSVNDFAYIFQKNDNIEQKVMSALMMIEKAYLNQCRFNVIVTRQKQVYTSIFVRISCEDLAKLEAKYGECYEIETKLSDNTRFIKLKLDMIWKKSYPKMSFPQMKRLFLSNQLLDQEGIHMQQQIKVMHALSTPYQQALDRLQDALSVLKDAFTLLCFGKNKYFEESKLKNYLMNRLDGWSEICVDKLVNFCLSTYSNDMQTQDLAPDPDAFLQHRMFGDTLKYHVMNNQYIGNISSLIRLFVKLFDNNNSGKSCRYLSKREPEINTYMRLGSLMEIMGIGSFSTCGGDDPQISILINEPEKVRKDCNNKFYKNPILESVIKRHEQSVEIFKHFFENQFDNDTRWNLIEDYFLGDSLDTLKRKYPSTQQPNIDAIEYVKACLAGRKPKRTKALNKTPMREVVAYRPKTQKQASEPSYEPKEGAYYTAKSLLTIGGTTYTISQWVSYNPMLLKDKIEQYHLRIPATYMRCLRSKLNASSSPCRDLHSRIKFPNIDGPVVASVPFNNSPVEFYKWWRQNNNPITLTFREKYDLFSRVNRMDANALDDKDRALVA